VYDTHTTERRPRHTAYLGNLCFTSVSGRGASSDVADELGALTGSGSDIITSATIGGSSALTTN